MSLEEQIRCMQEMRAELEDFCRQMKEIMETLDTDIADLKSQGFSVETAEKYRNNYYRPANDDVEQVISDIQHQHFDYIDEVISKLQDALQEE